MKVLGAVVWFNPGVHILFINSSQLEEITARGLAADIMPASKCQKWVMRTRVIQSVRHSELQRDRPQHNDQEASKGTVHQKSTTQSSPSHFCSCWWRLLCSFTVTFCWTTEVSGDDVIYILKLVHTLQMGSMLTCSCYCEVNTLTFTV